MIGFIKGTVLDRQSGQLLVGVSTDPSSSSDQVGYLVQVPDRPLYESFAVGSRVELFIYSHVREDAFDLYGFSHREEKELFLTLLSVNGIGPRGAMGILSHIEPGSLIQSILEEDKARLNDIPGVGKKTAERVVLELSDKLEKKVEQGGFRHLLGSLRVTSLQGGAASPSVRKSTGLSLDFSEAKEALMGLGYKENQIDSVLHRISQSADLSGKANTASELVRLALQQVGGA